MAVVDPGEYLTAEESPLEKNYILPVKREVKAADIRVTREMFSSRTCTGSEAEGGRVGA